MFLEERLQNRLSERQHKNLYRKRLCIEGGSSTNPIIDGKEYLSFSSNDYLGLANHAEIINAFKKAADEYGVGAGASHLVSGHKKPHHQLEEELADFCGSERALVYSSGYMANAGIASALFERRDSVFHDRLNHASLLDAIVCHPVNSIRYHHNDLAQLEALLQKKSGQVFIVTDGVFSMDGDIADIKKLSELAIQNSGTLWVDDAHGFGVLGNTGQGSVEYFELQKEQLPVYMATLGKAAGVSGAFVAGSEILIESLIQFSRNYVYTTAMPAAIAAACRVSLKLIQNESWRRDKVLELSKYLQTNLKQIGYITENSDTTIVPLILGETDAAVSLSEKLFSRGIYVTAIRPPTVAKGSARLRFTLSANHTENDVNRLVDTLMNIKE